MDSLLQDWKNYRRGKVDFDKSHFFSMFTLDLTPTDLMDIFEDQPDKNALVKRVQAVRSAGTLENRPYIFPKIKNRCSADELIFLASNDLAEKRRICLDVGDRDLANIIDRVKYEYVEDHDRIDRALRSLEIPHCLLYDLVGDYMAENIIKKDDQYYALAEAFYGLGANYDLAYYMKSPLIGVDVNFTPYFDFWRRGGRYVLTDDMVLVGHVFPKE